MGTHLENFADFVAATPDVFIDSPQKFINEATDRTYTFGEFLRGDDKNVIQGGKRIKEEIMFDESNTMTEYSPNDRITYTQPQVFDEVEIEWRFHYDQASWTKHEIELNIPPRATRDQIYDVYKSLKHKIDVRLMTSIANGLEARLWRGPDNNQNEMETGNKGTYAFSIPAFLSEDTTNYHPGGWTTIMGIDPATESGWRNPVTTYDADDPDDTDGDNDGLFRAFQQMWLKLQYKVPRGYSAYMDETDLRRQKIYTDETGWLLYTDLLRDSNDRLVRPQDPNYGNPTFNGIPVEYISALDTAALYDDGSSGYTTEDQASKDGPRFWWINCKYIVPVFHSSNYIKKEKPMPASSEQPWTFVQPVDIWYNLFCKSRRRGGGIVTPVA